MEGEEVHAVFERNDPAVEQITWPHLLAPKIVDQQDAAIGFHLERRFIKFMDLIVDEIEPFQSQFAANHNKRTPNFHPARVAPLACAQVARAPGSGWSV